MVEDFLGRTSGVSRLQPERLMVIVQNILAKVAVS